jgi:hypothetical protein
MCRKGDGGLCEGTGELAFYVESERRAVLACDGMRLLHMQASFTHASLCEVSLRVF